MREKRRGEIPQLRKPTPSRERRRGKQPRLAPLGMTRLRSGSFRLKSKRKRESSAAQADSFAGAKKEEKRRLAALPPAAGRRNDRDVLYGDDRDVVCRDERREHGKVKNPRFKITNLGHPVLEASVAQSSATKLIGFKL